MAFHDHFSSLAAEYAAFRPRYPEALFRWLAEITPRRERAWDCGTGNGQAALGLAEHFAEVLASDASAPQIAHALPHPRVTYRVAPAERSGLEPASVDLVTVAQALHWFDLDAFYAEARRVLRPRGVLAAWCYANARVDDQALDRALRRFHDETMGPYWPPERAPLLAGYRTLPFPFAELVPPSLEIAASLTLDELAAYLRTWSSVNKFREAHGTDPVEELVAQLRERWPEGKRHGVRWPIGMRVGRAG